MRTRVPDFHAVVRVIAFCLCGLFLTGLPANAADRGDGQAIEMRIKAAFIRHFCTYVGWPASAFEDPDSPIVLGVVGSNAMANALRDAVGDRTAHGRSMIVRQLDSDDALDDLHLLFIADSMRTRIPELAAAAVEQSILVITESPGALEAGSVVNFTIEDDKVKFDIAPTIARRAGLDVSAQLLTVARVVQPEGGQ